MTKKIFIKILTFAVTLVVLTAILTATVLGIYFDLPFSKEITGLIIVLAILLVLAFIFSAIVSKVVTKAIINPVEQLGENLDNIENVKTYSELQPFVEALSKQRKKEKLLAKQKKQFTANISHELKTPLTSIAGYAELIESGIAKEEDVKPFASIIRKQALRLVTLSEDIIKLSQLEENDDSTNISFSSVDIYEIAQNCTQSLMATAKLRGISLVLEGESTFIKGNYSLLEELIYNLCDNAIRYNKENGSVIVKIDKQDNKTVLTVSDTGIGIDKKYQEHIFERFFRVDKSRSKETGGTGLGLAIVKHIAMLHSAEVTINSEIGQGTAISVHFEK
jgi:two-component system phosphate regulon sensor histidine kinase PhoR